MGIIKDVMTRVDFMERKNAYQILSCMDLGASRVLETHVGYIVCDQNAQPE